MVKIVNIPENNNKNHYFWHDYVKCNRGNAVVLFALVFLFLMVSGGVAVDYAHLLNRKAHLQNAADLAAVAGANEMYVAQSDSERITAVAKSVTEAALNTKQPYKIASMSDRNLGVVKVALQQSVDLAFGAFYGHDSSIVAVESKASIVGSGRICVIGLEGKSSATVSLQHDAVLDAPTCSVFSNSTNKSGLKAKGGSRLTAEMICSAGGTAGSHGNFSPQPLKDCPAIPDPLSSRPAPMVGVCDFDDIKLKNGVRTLTPGTYCGGISISGNASVTLKPGIYILNDGSLVVGDKAQLRGEYVGFYFTGKKAKLRFERNTTIDLAAPKNGKLAGILFFQDRAAKAGAKFHITSNNARNLLGTIYLPKGRLYIDADADIAKQSAYTAVVVSKLELSEGPTLHLNTDYHTTDIPVPSGVGPVGGNVMLTK